MAERPIIYIIDSIAESAIDAFAEHAEVVRHDNPARHDWPEHAHAIVTRTTPISADQIGRAKSLRVIAKHGIGLDHIDLAAARASGIPVINTPGTNAQSVAELTVMMAISIARKAGGAEAALRRGAPGDTAQWRGFEIAGRRVGIVGLGNVGRKTAPIFRQGFACPVVAFDPYIDDAPFQALDVARAPSLNDLLRQTEILCLHVPLNEETRGMIGGVEMALMPANGLVINVARGGVVDEAALHDALAEGHLFGAATDVFVEEPPHRDHPLLSVPNFVATPHIGAATTNSAQRSGIVTVEKVLAILFET